MNASQLTLREPFQATIYLPEHWRSKQEHQSSNPINQSIKFSFLHITFDTNAERFTKAWKSL